MLKTLDRYKHIIQQLRIVKFEQFDVNLRFKAEIVLIDHSKLHVNETVIDGKKRKYSYHWQSEAGDLIIRWDNAPDWDVETFPHHKHVGNTVKSSYERTLEQVLKVIDNKITQK